MSGLDKQAKILWEIDDNDPKKCKQCAFMICYLEQQIEKGEWEEVISIVRRSVPQNEVKRLLNEIVENQLKEVREKTKNLETLLYLINNQRKGDENV